MNRVHELIVAAAPQVSGAGVVAHLGRDIRSRPDEIARHCLAQHRAINEDAATVAESVALADRVTSRHRAVGWARNLVVEIPVFELPTFQRSDVVDALIEAIHFLTGDHWTFRFVQRPGRPATEVTLPFQQISSRYVMAYSDGLDSYAQARLLEAEAGSDGILKLRSARMGKDSNELRRPVLRVPRALGPMNKPEQTYRSRPFVFFTFAGIGALVANAEAVVIGESGQGAMGPPLVRYAGEWPFRSAHPGFIARIARYLTLVFEQNIHFQLRQLWRTKGEVLRELAERNLLGSWRETRSCSVRPASLHGARTCGICGGCMLRRLACHSAGLVDAKDQAAFELTSPTAVAVDGLAMTLSERHLLVRSIGTMAEFARLSSGDERSRAIIQAESTLFGSSRPREVTGRLSDLVSRHAAEWEAFKSALPSGSWAHDLATQL